MLQQSNYFVNYENILDRQRFVGNQILIKDFQVVQQIFILAFGFIF